MKRFRSAEFLDEGAIDPSVGDLRFTIPDGRNEIAKPAEEYAPRKRTADAPTYLRDRCK